MYLYHLISIDLQLSCSFNSHTLQSLHYNYNKEDYFALSCLELKDIGDIKEIEEEEMSDKLGKEEP